MGDTLPWGYPTCQVVDVLSQFYLAARHPLLGETSGPRLPDALEVGRHRSVAALARARKKVPTQPVQVSCVVK